MILMMKWLKSWKCLINQDAGPGRDRLFLTCQVSAPEMPNTSVPARQLTSVIGNAGSGENLLFPVSGVGQLSNAKASAHLTCMFFGFRQASSTS